MSLSLVYDFVVAAATSSAACEAAVTIALFAGAMLLLMWIDQRGKKATTKSFAVAAKHVPKERFVAARPCPGKLPPGQWHCPESSGLVMAVRIGRTADLPQLLEGACLHAHAAAAPGKHGREEAQDRCCKLTASSLRACATRRHFESGLASYDAAAVHIGLGSADLWSLLLYISAEASCFERGHEFFRRLASCGQPKQYDYINVIRCFAHEQNMMDLRQLLQRMRASRVSLDNASRNKALAACVAKQSTEMAETIITSGVCSDALDVVAYNTLLKGYSKLGKVERCMALSKEMETRHVNPSAVTFDILLDVAAKHKDVATTRKTCLALHKAGMTYNTKNCTSILRALTSEGLVDEAANMLMEMRSRLGPALNLVAYSTVLSAYSQNGRTKESLQLMKLMEYDRTPIDDDTYLCVLEGTVYFEHAGPDVLDLYAQLMDLGMKASLASLSIVIKGLTRSRSFELARSFLEGSHTLLGAKVVKRRLFLQLGQACIREGCGGHAACIYRSFLKLDADGTEVLDGLVAQELIRTCLAKKGREQALQIHSCAVEAGVPLPGWAAKSVSVL